MTSLTLDQFREIKLGGFARWETAVTPGYEGATPYVDPVDARFGASSKPLGTDPTAIGDGFERWCTDNLAGDYFLVAGIAGALVYCQLARDAELVRRSFAV